MNETSDDSDTIKTGMEIGVITRGEFLNEPQSGEKMGIQQPTQEITHAAQMVERSKRSQARKDGWNTMTLKKVNTLIKRTLTGRKH